MKTLSRFLIPPLVLAATVPWFFVERDDSSVFGLPPWAAYSLMATAVYACVVAAYLARPWPATDEDQ
ncbi:MAG: hypothetical protein AAF517_00525 [Planctomycetota bacterium]